MEIWQLRDNPIQIRNNILDYRFLFRDIKDGQKLKYDFDGILELYPAGMKVLKVEKKNKVTNGKSD